jgi:uncharacterized protein with beta-barrel porin domain
VAAAIAGLIGGLALLASGSPVFAQSATWLAAPTVTNPADGNFDFNANANWNPATAPGSMTQTGTATFGMSAGTNISFSAGSTTLDGFTFTAAASNYAFFTNANILNFVGAGIAINGGSANFANSNGGTTQFFNASTAGSATITNNNGGLTFFGQSGGTDTSSAGSAKITNNHGSTTFLATSTAGNAIITNNNLGSGTAFFDSSTAGSADITNNGGNLTFSNSGSAGSATITNNSGSLTRFFLSSTAGSAIFTNNIGGTIAFFDTSTAGSATITNNGGQTQFGQVGGNETSSAGTAFITNTNGGATVFRISATAASANITNNNNSSTVFFDSSTAGSAKITNNGGGTAFSDTSTAGSAAITNISGGSALFFASTTAGNATITNNGGSANFFDTTTGNVHISNNGGTFFNNNSSAGSANITNNNGLTLFLNSSSAGTATITNNSGGVIQFFKNSDGGAASLINAGGIIDFTESSGPLGNGVLSVGALSGAGVFDVLSSQRIHVTGSLAFTSGALYIVNVRGSNASQINVNGTATLAGVVGVQANTRLTQATTFTILTSSGLNGTTFSGVTLDFANGFARDPVLSYVGNNVLLTLQPGLLSPLLPTNAPANQVKVAAAIDNALLAGNNLTTAFSAIFNLSGNGLLNGLTQLSGETATGAQQTTFDAMGQFMGLMTDPFMSRGGGLGGAASPTGYADEASAYAATKRTDAFAMFTKAPPQTFEPRWSVWAAGFGGSQSTSGNIALGSNNTTSNIAATAVGADYLFSPDTIAGFALAGGGTSFSVANGGTGRSDLFQAGAYVRHISGAAYVTAYGWQDITTNRTLMVAGLDQLRAEFNANAWSGRLEGGYRFVAPALGGLGITPYGAAQFVTFDLPQYAEQAIVGLNTFALSYGARDVTDVRTELGIRTDKSYAMADGILTLRGRLAWAHDYDPDRSIAATFQTLPAGSFVVNGASQASDSALTTAAVEMKWKNGWSAAATFEGEFSGVTTSYAGKGVVRYVW